MTPTQQRNPQRDNDGAVIGCSCFACVELRRAAAIAAMIEHSAQTDGATGTQDTARAKQTGYGSSK